LQEGFRVRAPKCSRSPPHARCGKRKLGKYKYLQQSRVFRGFGHRSRSAKRVLRNKWPLEINCRVPTKAFHQAFVAKTGMQVVQP